MQFIKPGLSTLELKVVLYQIYETEYGIFDHISATNRPLSSVAFYPAEDSLDGSPLDSIMRTYIDKNIKETFGLSLLEFLDLPRDTIELMIEISNGEMKKKQPVMDKLASDLNKLQ